MKIFLVSFVISYGILFGYFVRDFVIKSFLARVEMY